MVTWTTTSSLPDNQPRAEPTGSPQLAVAPQPSCTNVPWDVGGLQGSNWNPRRGPSLPQSRCPPVPTRSAHARTPTYPLRLHKILLDPHRKVPAEELGGRKAKPTCSRAGGDSGMERERQAVARNRKVVLRGYIDRAPREEDMELVDGGAVELRVPEGGGGPAVLVKNLYLSCDPYMRGRMRDFRNSYIPPFKPGSVSFPRLPFHFFGGACPLGLFWLAAEAAGCKVGWAIRALIEQFLDL